MNPKETAEEILRLPDDRNHVISLRSVAELKVLARIFLELWKREEHLLPIMERNADFTDKT